MSVCVCVCVWPVNRTGDKSCGVVEPRRWPQWDLICSGEIGFQLAPTGGGLCVCVCVFKDGTVKLWEYATGKRLQSCDLTELLNQDETDEVRLTHTHMLTHTNRHTHTC